MIQTSEVQNHEFSGFSDLIIFSIGKEIVCLDLSIVKEVIEIDHVKPFPLASERVGGIINLRGEVLPILNMKNALNIGGNSEEKKGAKKTILIIEHPFEKFGFLVDAILEIIPNEDQLFSNVPETVQTEIDVSFIKNIGQFKNTPLIFMDIDSILEKIFTQSPLALKTKTSARKKGGNVQTYIDQMERGKKPSEFSVKLTETQHDALKELANIAAGNAITALSELLKIKKKIDLFVSNVEVVNLADIPDILGGPENVVFTYQSMISRDISATNYLIFPFDGLAEILYQTTEYDIRSKNVKAITDLNPDETSAIQEIGNIVTAHYTSAISDFLRINMYQEAPEIGFDMIGALIDSFLAEQSQYLSELVCLHTTIRIEALRVDGAFFFIPHKKSLNKLINALTVENVTKIHATATAANPGEKPVKPAKKVATKSKAGSKQKAKTAAKGSGAKPKPKSKSKSSLKISSKDVSKITKADLDIFSELGNIGAGNASNALSQMINKKVMIDVPNATLMKMDQVKATIEKIGTTITGTFSLVTQNVDANILLIFSVESMENLLQILVEIDSPPKIRSISDITENEQSAIMEINSILIGHFVSAMSNFLRVPIDPPKHNFFFETVDDFNKRLESQTEAEIVSVCIETKMDVIETSPIVGYFILIPAAQNLKAILKRIHEIWEQ